MSKPVIAATPGEGPRPDLSEPIVIRRKAIVGWKVAGAGVFFGGLGCIIWTISVSTHPIAAHVYGAMLIAVAIYGLWHGMEEAIRRPGAVVVSKEGVKVLRGRALHLIQWSDLKGAHAAAIRERWTSDEIIGLQLVDPQSFHARFYGNKRHWLWPGSGKRPNCYPIYSGDLDVSRSKLIELFDDGIRRWGTYDPELRPQTSYGGFSNWEPLSTSLIAILLMTFVAVLAAPFALGSAPRWVEARPRIVTCAIRTRMERTGGICVPSGRGRVSTGAPKAKVLSNGSAMAEEKRAMRGEWKVDASQDTASVQNTGCGTKVSGRTGFCWRGRRHTRTAVNTGGGGTWGIGPLATDDVGWLAMGLALYVEALAGEGSAKGRQGEFKGHWTNGVPQGAGVFVTRDGRRFEGTWEDGKPVDAEMAHLQEQERWDCLWTVLPGRYDIPIRSEPWGCRIR